jgi:hypothetical protein
MKVALPYQDTKPQGAPDFYLAINTTFRFVKQRLGYEGLKTYWRDMGASYFRPVTKIWSEGGWPAVAGYWRSFFEAEPGAEVEVREEADRVVLEVRCCPAIAHLRKSGREIVPEFCQHCHFVSEAMGREAGVAARIAGGNGSCRQTFLSTTEAGEQNLEEIEVCQ